MKASTPHYLLMSESAVRDHPGGWRFVLRASDGSEPMVADDVEPEMRGERLDLLAVVRGLEALDQPSRVTLVTPSAYVREGIRYGVVEWRCNGWRWEAFGRMVPVKHSDLWRRIDRAMQFHQIECRVWRFDRPHQHASGGIAHLERPDEEASLPSLQDRRRGSRFQRVLRGSRRLIRSGVEHCSRQLVRTGAALVPCFRLG